MANATLRYQEVGAQVLRPFRSKKKEGKKKIKQSPITNYQNYEYRRIISTVFRK